MLVSDFIVCDDVRFEANGRVSLMGVYDGLVLKVKTGVLTWPFVVPRLGFYVRVRLEETDFRPESFVLSLLQDKKLVGTRDGKLELAADAVCFMISLVADGFPLLGPGTLTCAVELARGEQRVTVEPRNGIPIIA